MPYRTLNIEGRISSFLKKKKSFKRIFIFSQCCTACGILVSDQGLNLCPSVLAWRIPGKGEPNGLCLWGCTESDPTEVTLPLYFSRAQLLPLALSLECLGENKVSVLLHLTNTTCLAQGPICLGSLGDYLEVLWQCVFGLSGEKSQPVTEEQVCEPGAVRPHKPKHRSLQPGKVYSIIPYLRLTLRSCIS